MGKKKFWKEKRMGAGNITDKDAEENTWSAQVKMKKLW